MVLTPETSRLAKLLIDADGLSAEEAEAQLGALTLEIVIGPQAHCVAGHQAILTAVAVGRRTFAGGVSVVLDSDKRLCSNLPLGARTLGGALETLGVGVISSAPAARIAIGIGTDVAEVDAFGWWDNWRAGAREAPTPCHGDDNPLAGIVAGAACVARAFSKARCACYPAISVFDLWPTPETTTGPAFSEVFLPSELWILGLGNLGQASLWSLSALPYAQPQAVKLVLQDRDRISAENWGTSILVKRGEYGAYKTQFGEAWCIARGFDVRRVDRWVDENHRVQEGEPRIALCGFDKVEARKMLDASGYDLIIDTGLGRGHADFERFRISIFDREHRISDHFGQQRAPQADAPQDYVKLVGLDQCGAALFGQVAVAAPYVSAIAGAFQISRAIAISSGVPVPRNETRRLAADDPRRSSYAKFAPRGLARVKQFAEH